MFDRVIGTSATTGTGTYTLDSGTVSGFQTFFGATGGTATMVPYLATMGSGWEVGYGQYDGADPGTLARTVVLASSNAGAAVSWAAGSKEIAIAPSVQTFLGNGVRHTWGALTVPTASDDETLGYSPGSTWAVNRFFYICTYAAAGSAQWKMISSPFRTLINSAGNVDISLDVDLNDPSPRTDFAIAQYRDNTFDVFKQRGARILIGGDSSGTTPIDLAVTTAAGGAVIRGTAVATINSGANVRDSRAWDVAVLYNSTGAAAAVIGSPAITAIGGSATLSAAALSASASGTDILFTATGVTGEDVTWSLLVDVNETLEP